RRERQGEARGMARGIAQRGGGLQAPVRRGARQDRLGRHHDRGRTGRALPRGVLRRHPVPRAGSEIARESRAFPLRAGVQAAFCRFFCSQPSTRATVWSSTSERMPFCAAMVFTSRSTRSMLGAPLARARAADEGLPSESAALAYLSKGTRSL